ncbi:ABC transporter permease [Kribbella sandramycini]|uniref:Transport permease protein n=1 Tax=Kribbella sandramycini TaxID=60450 RepID=A0A7Y4P1W5_9ACTN|nr:ABC-2 type transport system permease protein [Kribbella sandramycini]NOL42530.1 ABC transporter permease [Kribbella sandramycini]
MNVWRDTWVVFRRALRLSVRHPMWSVLMLSQPLMYLLLFGPLLKPLTAEISQGAATNAYQVFIPGLIVQLGMFGAMFVGFGLIAEYRAGVIEADRVTPASRVALMAGRVLRDVVVLVAQSVLLLLAALPLGLRAPWAGVLLSLVIVALLGATFASLSYAVALITKSEDALAPLLNGIAMPLLLLSGILLPMQIGPTWLQRLSDISPLKHVVNGVRAMFQGDIVSSPALWGLFWVVLLTVVGLTVGARTFRKESA